VSINFYGDLHPGDEWVSPDALVCEGSMSVIARIYTPDGFVIAADGRMLDGATGAIVSDSTQKNFALRHKDGEIACSVAGLAQFTIQNITVKIGAEVARGSAAITNVAIKNSEEYSELLAERIRQVLEFFDPELLSSFSASLTHIYLDGYFLGKPMRRNITLTYKSTGVESVTSADGLTPGKPHVYGSGPLCGFLLCGAGDHSALQPYRDICAPVSNNAVQAVGVATAIVEAHCDPGALTIDKVVCQAVGGHIHIATVTPHDGFKWAAAPSAPTEPLDQPCD